MKKIGIFVLSLIVGSAIGSVVTKFQSQISEKISSELAKAFAQKQKANEKNVDEDEAVTA